MSLLQTRQSQKDSGKRVESSVVEQGPRVCHRDGTFNHHGAGGGGPCVQCRSGPEYPERQDCVTIPQTSERVGDLALVEVSPRAAPFLLRVRPLAFALLTSMNARATNKHGLGHG